jgi:hypothetical protein
LLGIHHRSHAVSTFAVLPKGSPSVFMVPGGLAIDREPGAMPYAVSNNWSVIAHGSGTQLIWHDRNGKQANLGPNINDWDFRSVELNSLTGDFMVCGHDFLKGFQLARMDRSGIMTTLTTIPGMAPKITMATKITQDEQIWVVGTQSLQTAKPVVLKYDLTRNAVVTLLQVPIPANSVASGVEVYGSRRLVCEQAPLIPKTVMTHLQSKKSGDGNKSYILACSFNRRPGVLFPHGEYLHLDVTDQLFFKSALGLAPSIFQNFHGVTDSKGNALARVNIPTTLPPNLGITVFVAGVIYDKGGVRTVTNTHWFVLP